ncbi:23S rRNA (adenine(2030)-N(6))-methyltransferase RlmJ [Mesobacterium sp. TK19101]|uniref:Ribosomal RNA large subunit methyltransferase J n=1 Tax=Mesobacterium hydrothermale TaxID=3111907 RepID=A0ABU6HDF6_9RHOB|nr:23S rRNA (adenine(2030)-N(6))-methyltransferase RlmJ [Mesobacterium sp. TK19101]MEC3860016.1 23S rRNA (adenine(2030)-N(6))-methyltransferase RlmJ [Mesobacterium sp. TK19101]
MLSYQHIYHAGNLADVQKHALLAWMLDYLTGKDKPMSYIETHAGRGLYDLGAAEAIKTGEAAQGIARAEAWFDPGHPYRRALARVRRAHGARSYPGSPLLAKALLRPGDSMHLAELHPQEHAALHTALHTDSRGAKATVYKQDGLAMAQSLCPPTPRRGLLLIDPSYEIRKEYDALPRAIAALHRKWNVGIIALWYPVLTDPAHDAMLQALVEAHPEALRHEVRFPPARDGHRMVGSGMFVVNPPFGLDAEAARLTQLFKKA